MTHIDKWLDGVGDAFFDMLSASTLLRAEHDLRLAAEDEARQLRARVAELDRHYTAALVDKEFWYKAYEAKAHELAALTKAMTR
jgi:hypothetical protein